MELKDFVLASAKNDELLSKLQNQEVSDEKIRAIEEASTLNDKVIEVLKTVNDPEIPVNIWDLGLVYNVLIADNNIVKIDMTLTAPGCPVAGALVFEVEKRIKSLLPQILDVKVTLVWKPQWNKEMMSDEAKLILDLW
jgi:FeS assembly SUF system protein